MGYPLSPQEIMGDFAIYFHNGDIKGLAQQMRLATQIDWQEKSKEAVEIAQRFSIENIISQWKALIYDK